VPRLATEWSWLPEALSLTSKLVRTSCSTTVRPSTPRDIAKRTKLYADAAAIYLPARPYLFL
jgi:hypothetical protein